MEAAFAVTQTGINFVTELRGTEEDIMNELPIVGMAGTIEGFASDTGKDENTVARAVNSLIKKGFLKVVSYTEEYSRAVRGKEVPESRLRVEQKEETGGMKLLGQLSQEEINKPPSPEVNRAPESDNRIDLGEFKML